MTTVDWHALPKAERDLLSCAKAAIARLDLDRLLADPDTWDDPDDVHRHGELTLTLTEAGLSATADAVRPPRPSAYPR
ncbi:hypothetical protein AB0M47_08295 [Hamadaea sp. NPDC051192]|uniref:hypothetical protein n=1 Tax=Hamadaea sp. NPDC051192 TaxID=3154940 RepID=UPI00343B3AAE